MIQDMCFQHFGDGSFPFQCDKAKPIDTTFSEIGLEDPDPPTESLDPHPGLITTPIIPRDPEYT